MNDSALQTTNAGDGSTGKGTAALRWLTFGGRCSIRSAVLVFYGYFFFVAGLGCLGIARLSASQGILRATLDGLAICTSFSVWGALGGSLALCTGLWRGERKAMIQEGFVTSLVISWIWPALLILAFYVSIEPLQRLARALGT